jgi:predicted nucleic-acid-binding Zn-ribbon protein
LAEKAIMAAEREKNAKGHLEVTCLHCRFTAVFAGRSRAEAWRLAVAAGWRRNAVTGTQSCPKCTKEREGKIQ